MAGDLIGHFSAESLNSLADGATVNSWVDSQQGYVVERDNGNPIFVKGLYGGRSAVRFSTVDGDDALVAPSNSNPIGNKDDFSVVVVFATSSDQLVGDDGQWHQNTGIVDASTLGFTKDWGISINANGQISAGISGGGLQLNSESFYSTETGLNDGQLHIITLTRQDGNLALYVDDGAATAMSVTDSGPRAADKLSFGRLLNRRNGFNGDITEARFYDGTLTPNEVSDIHQQIKSFYSNEAPVAHDDAYQMNEDGFLAVAIANGVLSNDTDADGDAITAQIVTRPQHGVIGFQSNGSFLYTPNKNFFGIDTFTYQVSDDLRPSEILGTASIEVIGQYDAPTAVADSYKAFPREVLRVPNFVGVLQNDNNIDNAALTAVLSEDVANGVLTLNADGSFDYDAQGFAGITSFRYRIDDGNNLSAPASVLLIVNTPPVAQDDTFDALEDVALSVSAANGVLANDTDADGNRLTLTLVDTTFNGVLTLRGDGSLDYVPNAEFSGRDFFTYRISDAQDESEIATATLNVQIVNDPPITGSDTYFALPGESLTVSAASGVLANDFDIDGPQPLTAVMENGPQNGNLTFQSDGGFSYIPNAGFEGADGFTYKATDSIDSSVSTNVEIQITNKPILINEIMVSNAGTLETQLRAQLEDEFEGETLSPDWIEIRNLQPTPLSIAGLHLTDDRANPTKWQIPNGTVVPADGYLAIFASGKDISDARLDEAGMLHTNFQLSTAGEYLAITSQSGDVIDELKDGYPQQRTHITYGADTDNPAKLGFFLQPTPGAANGNQLSAIVEDTKFNIDRGFFNEPMQVTITTATEGAEIRYTLDGSPPTERNGFVYEAPLTIDHTTSLRAAAFKDGLVPTNVDTASYLFVGDILQQTQSSILDAGFPRSWKGTTGDYGLDSENEFPRIAGDTNMPLEEAKQVIADALTAIPSFSIVTDVDNLFDPSTGIYSNPNSSGKRWERPTSVEMVHPDGTEGFQIDAGIRIQGGAFRSWGLTKKKSFRLLFKTQYGPSKLSYPLFGPDAVSEFDSLTVRMEANDGWQWNGAGGQPQYARDQFLRDVQNAMGQPASHGRAIHVYLNGLYWGMYNVVERPDQSFGAAYFGSDKYDWDGSNSGTPTNSEGDSFRRRRSTDTWRAFTGITRDVRRAETEQERTDIYLQLQGLNPDGTRNPEFPVYLDPENMIDYFIVNYYGDNSDWPHKNYYHGRENSPDSTGYKFFMWDAEWSLFLRSNVTSFSKINDRSGIALPFQDLRDSAEFRVLHGDRVHKHFFNGGVFYVDPENPDWDPNHPERNRPAQIYNEFVDEIFDALPAESARWGDQHRSRPYTRDNEWQREYDRIVGTWFTGRSQRLLDRYISMNLYPDVDAATFSQRGGTIQSDVPVSLSAPAGTIFYTTDGSDPRLIGGAVNPTAVTYTDPIVLDSNTTIKVRVLKGDEWSAIDEAYFVTNAIPATADSLRISEVNYNPGALTEAEEAAGINDKDEFEFIEFVNISDQTIDLTNVSLQQIVEGDQTNGLLFAFADAEIQQLPPGERLVVVENLAAFIVRYGDGLPVAGEWSGGLSNRSETITVGTDQAVFQQFTYQDAWYPTTDGNGHSLDIINASSADLNAWNEKASWKASAAIGGSPGTDGSQQERPGDSNRDGIFNSSDLVTVFQAGEYEDGIPGNSTFEEGDWNGDGDFDSADLVLAFAEGNYVENAIGPVENSRQASLGAAIDFGSDVGQMVEVHQLPPQQDQAESDARKVDLLFGEWENEVDREALSKHDQGLWELNIDDLI